MGVASPVASGLAGASSTFDNLKRRLMLLQQTDRVPPRFGAWLLVALVALAGALPYRVTARDMEMTTHAYDGMPQESAPPPAAAAPVSARVQASEPPQPAPVVATAPSPKPAVPAAAARAAAPMTAPAPLPVPPGPEAPVPLTALPPAPPPPPPPSAIPPAPPAPTRMGHTSHVDIDVEANAPRGFAIVEPDAITVQGNDSDLAKARALQRAQETLLWVRRGGDAYVVRDRTLLQRAQDAYAPMRDMARQQGQMAGRQGELAGRRSGLAARESALSMRRVELDRERAAISGELQQMHLAHRDGGAEAAAVVASFDGRLEAIRQQMADLDRQQADISRQQADFDRREAEVARQQAEMARHEHEVSRQVDSQMDRLIDDALAAGLAQRAESR